MAYYSGQRTCCQRGESPGFSDDLSQPLPVTQRFNGTIHDFMRLSGIAMLLRVLGSEPGQFGSIGDAQLGVNVREVHFYRVA